MKVISPRIHGYLDFLTVVIFLLAPTLLGLSQLSAILAYGLAVVHLIVTLASDFPFGVVKLIPFTIHGWIERMVGPLLIAIPCQCRFPNLTRPQQSNCWRVNRPGFCGGCLV